MKRKLSTSGKFMPSSEAEEKNLNSQPGARGNQQILVWV